MAIPTYDPLNRPSIEACGYMLEMAPDPMFPGTLSVLVYSMVAKDTWNYAFSTCTSLPDTLDEEHVYRALNIIPDILNKLDGYFSKRVTEAICDLGVEELGLMPA